MCIILQNNPGWDCFKTPILRRDLEDSKSTSGGTLYVLGSHTFVPVSWMCKKQTSVSHSSVESEIISLDAGWREDGIPALDWWDLIVLVFGNTTQNHDRTAKPVVLPWWESRAPPISRSDQCFGKCWLCSLKRPIFASSSFVVCVWRQRSSDQDDKKGRSHTMRHVSRTHRVALDWLFVRINLANLKFWNQKPIRRHVNQGKFHTWRVESSSCVC